MTAEPTTTTVFDSLPFEQTTATDLRLEYGRLRDAHGRAMMAVWNADLRGEGQGVDLWQELGRLDARMNEIARRVVVRLRHDRHREACERFVTNLTAIEAANEAENQGGMSPILGIFLLSGRIDEAALFVAQQGRYMDRIELRRRANAVLATGNERAKPPFKEAE